ncbi:L,D-transpeptidase family protein [Kitasatospora sp. NPDC057223]|uniref:L,D-transpeptidase family protein n=1 Tax=Kitasatospora sp. NPDC057223 TaxID=3346055 RepID=UPI00363F7215
MSGSHRAPAQPLEGVQAAGPGPWAQEQHASYEQAYQPLYEAQPPYESSGQPYQDQQYQQYQQYQPYEQPYDPYQQQYGQAYQQPYEVYEPEPEPASEARYVPEYEPEPGYEPVYVPEPEPAPVRAAESAPAAQRERGSRRKPKKKTHGRALTAGTALLLAATAGWYTLGAGGAPSSVSAADGGPEPAAVPDQPSASPAEASPEPSAAAHTGTPAADRSESRADGSLAAIPGLGAAFLARIPATTNQVVLASGKGRDANETTVTVWSRTPDGRWLAGEAWAGHNAYKGWTTDHNEGDLRSPIGVFTLTDAGGRDADPGSRLPYDKDPNFVVSGKGFAGEPLAGSFDYVVAINYNRVPGNSPLDGRRPDGGSKGGGIWIHVDHGGPTHGCVSVPEDKMAALIRLLDPAANPVIVMGDAATLAA